MGKREGIGKGTPGPGRPKGSANKVTKVAREAMQSILDDNYQAFRDALAEVRAEDPLAFAKLYLEVQTFCVPRLKSIEHTAGDDTKVDLQIIGPSTPKP